MQKADDDPAAAVERVEDEWLRTSELADSHTDPSKGLGTEAMGDKVVEFI